MEGGSSEGRTPWKWFLSLPRGEDSRIHVNMSVKAISASGTATLCPWTVPPQVGAPLGTGKCSKVFPERFFSRIPKVSPQGGGNDCPAPGFPRDQERRGC